jgi:nucleotide-binding universal stress UspA family protein
LELLSKQQGEIEMFKSILVALDGSEPSDRALKTAASLAASIGAELILTHILLRTSPLSDFHEMAERYDFDPSVVQNLDKIEILPPQTAYGVTIPSTIAVVSAFSLAEFAENYLNAAERIAREIGVNDIGKIICDGKPGAEILSWAEKKNADLIVVGSRGTGKVQSLFLGSTSNKVVQESPVSCLVVK